MIEAKCPNCKAPVYRARLVRIPTDADTDQWKGRQPGAIGFVCPQCGVLLPLSPTGESDEA